MLVLLRVRILSISCWKLPSNDDYRHAHLQIQCWINSWPQVLQEGKVEKTWDWTTTWIGVIQVLESEGVFLGQFDKWTPAWAHEIQVSRSDLLISIWCTTFFVNPVTTWNEHQLRTVSHFMKFTVPFWCLPYYLLIFVTDFQRIVLLISASNMRRVNRKENENIKPATRSKEARVWHWYMKLAQPSLEDPQRFLERKGLGCTVAS